MKKFSLSVSLVLVAFLAGAGLTYLATTTSWVSDMANQPSIEPQELPFAPPAGAVPVGPERIQLAAHEEKTVPAGPKQEPVAVSGDHHAGESPTAPHHHGGAMPAGPDHHGGSSAGSEGHHGGASPAGGDHHGGASPAEPGHHGAASPLPDDHHGGAAPAGEDHHGGASPSSEGHHGGTSPSPQSHQGGHEDVHGMAMEMVNPVAPTSTSVREGEALFKIYCRVCHGARGQGGMPIGQKYPGIPRFTRDLLRQTPDSHMFSMLTSGHGPMPGYAEALSRSDRWNVINYVRKLQNEL